VRRAAIEPPPPAGSRPSATAARR